jgi:hypothetical protein
LKDKNNLGEEKPMTGKKVQYVSDRALVIPDQPIILYIERNGVRGDSVDRKEI